MSAAPVLYSVLATALPKGLKETVRSKPIETLAFYRKYTESLASAIYAAVA